MNIKEQLTKDGYEIIEIVHRDPYTMAHVRKTFYGDLVIDGYGFAKRNPTDTRDDDIGEMLALWRARADAIQQYAVACFAVLRRTADAALRVFTEPCKALLEIMRRLP